MALFEITGVDEFADAVKLIQDNYPKEIKKFMQKEGNKLKKMTLAEDQVAVAPVTGNYFKGIKRGKYYKYNGMDSIRVYAGTPAYHAHLLECGHNIQKKKGGKVYGRTTAFKVFEKAHSQFQPEYESDCEKFADDLIKKLD
ncbi:MAG: HK97 gp10 family phage protein [Clostridiales bacterium]|nr:HK97 gp10 family phage protein [Clostridiales bacterium]